ncbi:unnamed protein product [Triticum turgidum subsp. durum]|uniref:Golgin candidate 5 n=1 Tax=Triticum turgidum subsp. durum TaxID=4567 RepID=A0A9R0R4K4_TRITD|nr:unnamed protein product [Triticum turgidum subsp. durum]
MAWWSDKLSLGGLQDIAGAVNKISESVKNIEKNFDSALGLEEKRDDADEGSGSRTSNSDGIGFFNPVMAFMGHNGEESSTEVSEKQLSPKHSPALEENHRVTTEPPTSDADASEVPVTTQSPKQPSELQENVSSSAESHVSKADGSEQSVAPQSPTRSSAAEDKHDGSTEVPASEGGTSEVSETAQSSTYPSVAEETYSGSVETSNLVEKETQGHQDTEYSDTNEEALLSQPGGSVRDIPDDSMSSPNKLDQSSVMGTEESVDAGNEVTDDGNTSRSQSADSMVASSDDVNETKVNIVQEGDVQKETISPPESSDIADKASHGEVKVHDGETNTAQNGEENDQTEAHAVSAVENEDNATAKLENVSSKSIIVDNDSDLQNELVPAVAYNPVGPVEVDSHANDSRKEEKIQDSVTTTNSLESVGSVVELEKLKRDMKMMEAALQGAARQSQSKADEIARLMNENEQLKSTINELKGNKSVEEEMDALKDEYHQRVATLERKVYALTKERDTLRREQNKKSDAAALLKEKDEIITQVMAEGEELSRKQAAQEATIRKLRAQLDS